MRESKTHHIIKFCSCIKCRYHVNCINNRKFDPFKVIEQFTTNSHLYRDIKVFLSVYEWCYTICTGECICETIGSHIKNHGWRRNISSKTMMQEILIHFNFMEVGEAGDFLLLKAML